MTISRANVAAYLDTQYSNVSALIGQDTDTLTGYGPDIDNALRRLGKLESELVPSVTVEDGTRDSYFALAEYYAALRIWRQLGHLVTIKTDDSTFDYKHLLTNAKQVLDDVSARCAALGYDVSASGWSMGYLNLDWIEQEPAEV